MQSAPGICRDGRTRPHCRFRHGWRAACRSCCGLRWSHAGDGSDLPWRYSRMTSPRVFVRTLVALAITCVAASPSISDDASTSPFQPHVDMKTFMEHVLGPAAAIIWRVNGVVIDEKGEHDLSPKSDDDWEQIVSGAATLAEAANALMIPQRVPDAAWNPYVKKLADAADKAYRAAEAHDLKSVSEVSDQLDGICAACHRHYGLE